MLLRDHLRHVDVLLLDKFDGLVEDVWLDFLHFPFIGYLNLADLLIQVFLGRYTSYASRVITCSLRKV